MKICIRGYDIYANPAIPNTRVSGLTHYTEHLIRAWRQTNPEIEISFIRSSAELLAPCQVDDLKVYSIFTSEKEIPHQPDKCLLKGSGQHEDYYRRAKVLAEILADDKPNILHLHNPRPALEYIHAKKFFHDLLPKMKCLLTMHDLNDLEVPVIAEHADWFDGIVAISTSVLERCVAYGIPREHLTLIPSGVDVEAYQKLIGETSRPEIIQAVIDRLGLKALTAENSFRILMPARRVPHKGHRDALRALTSLNADASGARRAHLLITGAGLSAGNAKVVQYEQELAALAAQLGIENCVHFLPPLSERELACLFQWVDAILTPSTDPEGFCFANIEAMLASTPVITSNTGGPLDYITPGITGYFVNPGDANDIAEKLRALRRAPAPLSLLETAKDTAGRFTLKKMAERYIQLFGCVLEDRGE